MTKIQTDFALTIADWQAAQRFQSPLRIETRKKPSALLFVLVGTGFLVGFAGPLLQGSDGPIAAVVSALSIDGNPFWAIGFAAFCILLALAQSQHQFRASGAVGRPLSYVFHSSTLNWTDSAGEGTYALKFLLDWQESPDLFVLGSTLVRPILVPKRALDEQQQVALRALLVEQVGPQGEPRSMPEVAPLEPSKSPGGLVMETCLEKADLVAAQRVASKLGHNLPQLGLRLLVSLLGGTAMAKTFTGLAFSDLFGSLAQVGWSLVLFVFLTVSLSKQSAAMMTRLGFDGVRTRMTFLDDTFRLETPFYQQKRRLSALYRWLEAPTLFVLFESPVGFYMIPKRALTAAQTDEIRSLLTKHMGPPGTKRT